MNIILITAISAVVWLVAGAFTWHMMMVNYDAETTSDSTGAYDEMPPSLLRVPLGGLLILFLFVYGGGFADYRENRRRNAQPQWRGE